MIRSNDGNSEMYCSYFYATTGAMVHEAFACDAVWSVVCGAHFLVACDTPCFDSSADFPAPTQLTPPHS